MLNNINDTSFKANFRVTAPIKETSRLANIQRLFSEKTPELKDTLSLTKVEDFGMPECFHIGANPEKSSVVAFRESFDNMLEKLSDNDIVTKLIKTLQSIKALNKREGALMGRDYTTDRAQHEQERHLLIAKSCREKGNNIMAQRFEYIANCFGKKLEKVRQEHQAVDETFLKKLAQIADGDEDILRFSNYM